MTGVDDGLEVACAAPPAVLRCSRGFGRLGNQASVDWWQRLRALPLY
jgi:hypothetical protein